MWNLRIVQVRAFFTKIAKIYNTHEMATNERLTRLETRAFTAEELIKTLKLEVAEIKNASALESNKGRVTALEAENLQLRKEIEEWKNKLIQLETANGIKQVPLPKAANITHTTPPQSKPTILSSTLPDTPKPLIANEEKEQKIKTEKKKKEKAVDGKKGGGGDGNITEEPPIDVGRLDFRVGRIISAKKHPDADALYVEQVDVGEGKNRTVVSGLVKFVPVEELENRLVVLLCNLKPVKMRGITSEAMVMCASTPDKVEVLLPPPGCIPGDEVHVDGYPRVPDSVLNPKKKIFETVAPDLKTNSDKVATYKGIALSVPGKGVVSAPSLVEVNVK